jgi:hypothetical protein
VNGLYFYAFVPMKIDGLYSPVRHGIFVPAEEQGIEFVNGRRTLFANPTRRTP